MKIKFFFVGFLFLLTNNLVLAQDLEFESTTDNPLEQNILSEDKNENSAGCSVENQKLLSASLIQCSRKLTESKTACETELTESKIASEKQLKKKTQSLTACEKKLIDRKKKKETCGLIVFTEKNVFKSFFSCNFCSVTMKLSNSKSIPQS